VAVTHIINGFLDANPDLERLRPQVPLPPAILPLTRKKSTLFPTPMQDCDEAKIDGNIEYVRRVLQYLGIDDASLEDRIFPLYGNVFSVDRVRQAVGQCSIELSENHFDQFKFAEPFMGPFHLLVSRLRQAISKHQQLTALGEQLAIIHSFYTANAGVSKYQDCLAVIHTRIPLDRKTMKFDLPDFHEGNQFIKLHVAALSHLHICEQLSERKTPPAEKGLLFGFNKEGLTMKELVKAAEAVAATQLKANVELADQHGADVEDPETWDTVHLHGVSLFRHALIYTEVRHATKHGDPGRMKAMFPYLVAIFKATRKHRYANEILEVPSRWKSEWNDDLRATMLCHSLVNATGKPDGWIGIELRQEHEVRLHKVDFPVGDNRGPAEANLHKHLSGCLHTLRSAKIGV
jgi:hypothetical protein